MRHNDVKEELIHRASCWTYSYISAGASTLTFVSLNIFSLEVSAVNTLLLFGAFQWEATNERETNYVIFKKRIFSCVVGFDVLLSCASF